MVQHIQVSQKVGGLKMFADDLAQLRRDVFGFAGHTADTADEAVFANGPAQTGASFFQLGKGFIEQQKPGQRLPAAVQLGEPACGLDPYPLAQAFDMAD